MHTNICSALISSAPDVLILLIIDNDLLPSSSSDLISTRILSAVHSFPNYAPTISSTYICQPLPRHPGLYYWNGYNELALSTATTILQEVISLGPHIRLLRIRDFPFPSERIQSFNNSKRFYTPDYTHLNDVGNEKLYKGLMHAVISATSIVRL